jgi:aspartyl-tRNA(Asn)/glutamyl-tRNA(Gln) amidotransferase subunit C
MLKNFNKFGKKTLEYLAELSRIELEKESEEKLLKDFQKILAYFEELKEVDTEKIDPVRNKPPQAAVAVLRAGRISNGAGETIEKNVFRNDEEGPAPSNAEGLTEQFPEKENGFLKIPPVFE